jgi:hypothetical protein
MAARVLVDVDGGGIAEYAHFDSDGNLLGLEWEADVESVLEANKRRQTDGAAGYGPSREWRHTASVPPIMLLKWAVEKGVHPSMLNSREGFEDIVLKMVADPDYRFLRTDR